MMFASNWLIIRQETRRYSIYTCISITVTFDGYEQFVQVEINTNLT